MKKLKKIDKIYIIVPLIVFLSLFLIVLGVYSSAMKKKKGEEVNNNFYRIEAGIGKMQNEVTVSNDTLSSLHCLNELCVENVVIHDGESMGRVDYTIKNNTNNNLSGYLKLVFSEKSIIIYYSVNAKSSVDSTAQYNGFNIGNELDYSLQELTNEDLQLIVVK